MEPTKNRQVKERTKATVCFFLDRIIFGLHADYDSPFHCCWYTTIHSLWVMQSERATSLLVGTKTCGSLEIKTNFLKEKNDFQ